MDVLHEVHLIAFSIIQFLVRCIDTVPGVKQKLRKIRSVAHVIASEHATMIGQNYGDSRVHGFLNALKADTNRDRGLIYEVQYNSTFGKEWSLPLGFGNYARVIQMITYMAVTEALELNDQYHVIARVRKLVKEWRIAMHNGVYMGTPKQVAFSARTLTKTIAHNHLIDSMRESYGGILDAECTVIDWLQRNLAVSSNELAWVRSVQITKRRLLSCIKFDSVIGIPLLAGDEVRRTLISLIKEQVSIVPQLMGDLDDVWKYIERSVKPAAWVVSKGKHRTVTKVKRASELKAWIEEILDLHRKDHIALDEALQEWLTPPPEEPARKQVSPPKAESDFLPMFTNLEIGAPEVTGIMRIYAEIISRVEGDDDLEFMDSLDPDAISEDIWIMAIKTYDAEGQDAAIALLKEQQGSREIRD